MSSTVRRRAVTYLQAGQRSEARRLLRQHVLENPHDELAWLWYVETLDNNDHKIRILQEFLLLHPTNKKISAILAKLQNQKAAQSTPVSKRGRHLSYALYASAGLLALFLCSFLSVSLYFNNHLGQELAALRIHYQNLQHRYSQIVEDHEALSKIYDKVQRDHAQAVFDYNTLNDEHQHLQNDYNVLNGEYSNLVTQYNQLGLEYGNLSNEYNQYRTRALAPPYIYIHGRSVELAFLGSDNSLIRWHIPFESLEANIIRGYRSRNNQASLVSLSLSEQETVQLMDFRPYVDPQPFDEVISELYAKSARDSEFIYQVWQIIAQLTSYSTEINETPRYPLETLLSAGGDCEDTSILFASMIKAAPVDWEVSLVYIDSYNPTEPKEVNHVLVKVDTGVEVYLVETTSKDVMSPYINGVRGWFFPVDG